MELFGIRKYDAGGMQKLLPNRDLLYISFDPHIPPVNRGMYISVSFDGNGNFNIENSARQIPDPSTIYVHLPIAKGYASPLPYWPHYIEMSPQQRYNYLSWLRNVEEPVDMGYVFIYYYGLERQMLTGNFDKAFDETVKLRNVHKNKSFQKYTENALIHASIITGRLDKLSDLHERTEISGFSNAMFLLAFKGQFTFGATHLMLIFRKAFPLSKKAELEDRNLLEQCVSDVIQTKYPDGFCVKNYDISKTAATTETRFANYSFPPEVQNVDITDFYRCKPLLSDLETVFNESYRLFKDKKKMLKTGKTPEEIAALAMEKSVKRYRKLLKEKLITQTEYETLLKINQPQNYDCNS